ncbi:MAG: hypothetical protein MHM6MM_009583, partial [Cercozoa sp. M6MM]
IESLKQRKIEAVEAKKFREAGAASKALKDLEAKRNEQQERCEAAVLECDELLALKDQVLADKARLEEQLRQAAAEAASQKVQALCELRACVTDTDAAAEQDADLDAVLTLLIDQNDHSPADAADAAVTLLAVLDDQVSLLRGRYALPEPKPEPEPEASESEPLTPEPEPEAPEPELETSEPVSEPETSAETPPESQPEGTVAEETLESAQPSKVTTDGAADRAEPVTQ